MEATTDTKRPVTLFDKANFQLQNTIFQHDHIVMHGYIVSPLMNKSLHAVLVKICINGDDPLLLLPLLSAPPIPHCAHIHCLVSINVRQASVNVSGCHFSTWRNSVMHLFSICSSMSDITASTCNRILVGRFDLSCHTTNIHL